MTSIPNLENCNSLQSLAIPHVLDGKNTLITSETGNGKTLSYIAPMLQQIAERKKVQPELPMNSPMGLVIVPGKELAAQIQVSSSVCIPSSPQILSKQMRDCEVVNKSSAEGC